MLTGSKLTVGYHKQAPVCTDIDLTVPRGQVTGLAGPSGCGKSTLARMLALLLSPWRGTVSIDGEPVRRFRYRAPRHQRHAIGIVFQSPRRSCDPRFTLEEIMAEPLRTAHRPAAERSHRLAELADQVGLTHDLRTRHPREVSDGQLQRACLARALALRPRYLICDEMTAMLDASTTAALVNVVGEATREIHLGVLAISHDSELLDVWADDVRSLT